MPKNIFQKIGRDERTLRRRSFRSSRCALRGWASQRARARARSTRPAGRVATSALTPRAEQASTLYARALCSSQHTRKGGQEAVSGKLLHPDRLQHFSSTSRSSRDGHGFGISSERPSLRGSTTTSDCVLMLAVCSCTRPARIYSAACYPCHSTASDVADRTNVTTGRRV